MTAPLTYPAASLANHVTAPATSSAVANRPSGIASRYAFCRSSGSSAVLSVAKNQGATTLAVMLRLPSSRVIDRAMPTRPALLAA